MPTRAPRQVVLAVVLGVLAGCSDSGDSPSGTGDGASTTQTQPTTTSSAPSEPGLLSPEDLGPRWSLSDTAIGVDDTCLAAPTYTGRWASVELTYEPTGSADPLFEGVGVVEALGTLSPQEFDALKAEILACQPPDTVFEGAHVAFTPMQIDAGDDAVAVRSEFLPAERSDAQPTRYAYVHAGEQVVAVRTTGGDDREFERHVQLAVEKATS